MPQAAHTIPLETVTFSFWKTLDAPSEEPIVASLDLFTDVEDLITTRDPWDYKFEKFKEWSKQHVGDSSGVFTAYIGQVKISFGDDESFWAALSYLKNLRAIEEDVEDTSLHIIPEWHKPLGVPRPVLRHRTPITLDAVEYFLHKKRSGLDPVYGSWLGAFKVVQKGFLGEFLYKRAPYGGVPDLYPFYEDKFWSSLHKHGLESIGSWKIFTEIGHEKWQFSDKPSWRLMMTSIKQYFSGLPPWAARRQVLHFVPQVEGDVQVEEGFFVSG